MVIVPVGQYSLTTLSFGCRKGMSLSNLSQEIVAELAQIVIFIITAFSYAESKMDNTEKFL